MITLPVRQWVSKALPVNQGPWSKPTKHVAVAYNPVDGWIYTCGGDYAHTTPAGISAESGTCEMWRYSVELHRLEIVQPYCRPDGGLQPNGADEVGWCYNTKANRFVMHPGFMWGHSGACPGTNMIKNQIMEFDPVASSWALSTVPPSLRGTEGNFTQYDPVTDTLTRFCNAGPEAQSWSYVTRTWTRYKWPLPNLNFSDTGTTIDVQGRAIYFCTGNKLWRYNLDAHGIEDLGTTPQTTFAENKPVWDSINKVLLWPCFADTDNETTPGVQEWARMHVYHPDTRTWEVDVVSGTGVKGRHSVFDPANNCLILAGNVWNRPSSTSIHLFRYGQSTVTKPAGATNLIVKEDQ